MLERNDRVGRDGHDGGNGAGGPARQQQSRCVYTGCGEVAALTYNNRLCRRHGDEAMADWDGFRERWRAASRDVRRGGDARPRPRRRC
jgi:hypothetical protein